MSLLLFPNSIIPKSRQNQSNRIIDIIFRIKSFDRNIPHLLNTISEFDRSHNALFLTFYFFLNQRFREGFIQRDYDLIEKVFKTFLLGYMTALINLNKFIRFLDNWENFEEILYKKEKTKKFWMKISEVKDTILVDIIQQIASKFDFSNYPEWLVQYKSEYQNKQNQFTKIEKEQTVTEMLYEFGVSVQVVASLIRYLYTPNFQIKIKRQEAQNERKIKLLQRLCNLYKISYLHRTVTITLYKLYPAYSIKFLIQQKKIYFLILYLYNQIFSIQSKEANKNSNSQLFYLEKNKFKQFHSIQNISQILNLKSITKESQQFIMTQSVNKDKHFYEIFKFQHELKLFQLDNFQKLQNYLPCLKLKRYFVKELTLSLNNFYVLFFFMIEKKCWKDSFELLTEYLRQALYGKSNHYRKAYIIATETIISLDFKENFDSYLYSLQFFNFLEEQAYFKTNKLTYALTFPIYLNLLYFRELPRQNPQKFKKILLNVYQLYPQFCALPKQFLEIPIRNKIALQMNQQIYQITIRYLLTNTKQRKYKIFLRQLIKKVYFLRQMGDSFIQEQCNKFTFNFFQVKNHIKKTIDFSKAKWSIVRKTKAVLVKVIMEKEQKDAHSELLNQTVEEMFQIIHYNYLTTAFTTTGRYQYLEKKRDFCKKYEIPNFALYKALFMKYYSKNPNYLPKQLSYPVQQAVIIDFYLFEQNQSQIKSRIERVKRSDELKILEETLPIVDRLFGLQLKLYTGKLEQQNQKNMSELKWIRQN